MALFMAVDSDPERNIPYRLVAHMRALIASQVAHPIPAGG
jgi:hypothetical protein